MVLRKRPYIRKKHKTRLERDLERKILLIRSKMVSNLPEECKEYNS